MSRLFLCYARENGEQASRLAQALSARNIGVWQDHARLRAGARWPKALGEAIANSDALLLLWSAEADTSNFVELEWNTALAMHIPVLLCLLDATPLPHLLRAIHSEGFSPLDDAADSIAAALREQATGPSQSQTQPVVRELEQIRAEDPFKVLQEARAVFHQNQWNVQGSVYIGAPAKPEKSRLEKWQTRVAIVVGLLTTVTLVIALLKTFTPSAPQPAPKSEQQILAGAIWSESGDPLEGVRVSLDLEGKPVSAALTNREGRYEFHVSGAPNAEVSLVAQKSRFSTLRRYVRLGNSSLNLQMHPD